MFDSRESAGKRLAEAVAARNFPCPIVLAIPRGGVPVGAEIARRLRCPLDLLIVRKVGVPFQPELAAAAVVDGDAPEIVPNRPVMRAAGLTDADIAILSAKECSELERRRSAYLEGRPSMSVVGRTAIVVDDGIATGTSVRAGLSALRRRRPAAVVLATPIAPSETIAELRAHADEVVCLDTPDPFVAIGYHYRDFHQLSDAEVTRILAQLHDRPGERAPSSEHKSIGDLST